MTARLLSVLLLVLGLALTPAAMASGLGMPAVHAMAAPPSAASHCDDREPIQQQDRTDMSWSCAMACAACLTATPIAAETPLQPHATVAPAALPVLAGLLPESETPPPRNLPEI
jgi:hypothetical protein